MFAGFKYRSIPLKNIQLDYRNPRIVTQKKLSTQDEIVRYLFEFEDLKSFVSKIAVEGRNQGAERPYVVKDGAKYTVIEGNTRIAAYKVLAGLAAVPSGIGFSVPTISEQAKQSLLSIDCSVAPDRDTLLPIMANAHFGLGDKSKWGYLGSRKAVYDEWQSGKSISQLASDFDRTEGQLRELIIEYQLYLRALDLSWTEGERSALTKPSVAFNPPVRFLETSGHKAKMGIAYDMANLKIKFDSSEAESKFKHLLLKLVINPTKGLGATAAYDDVFADYVSPSQSAVAGPGGATSPGGNSTTTGQGTGGQAQASAGGASTSGSTTDNAQKPKSSGLFSYAATVNSNLILQLMKEAKDISVKKYPAATTFLLRNIVESLLKEIINQQKANPASSMLDLEKSINLCLSPAVTLPVEDKKVLKEFLKTHVTYLNLGAHGNVIPNSDRVMAARDCIDLFVKRNI